MTFATTPLSRHQAILLIPLDIVVLDGGGLDLFCNALLHIARGLTHLEKTLVRRVGYRIGANAWSRFWLWRNYFFDAGVAHDGLSIISQWPALSEPTRWIRPCSRRALR